MSRWTRIVQWRLSTLLIVTCLVGLIIGWQANIYRKQNDAINWLHGLECDVAIEYRPGWFYPLVKSVSVSGNIDTIEPLAWCPYLEGVDINSKMIRVEDDLGSSVETKFLHPEVQCLEPLSGLQRLKHVTVFSISPIRLGENSFSESLEILCVGSPYVIDPKPIKLSKKIDRVMFFRDKQFEISRSFTKGQLESMRLEWEQAAKTFDQWQKEFPESHFDYSW